MKNNLRKRIYQILSCILCVAFVYSMLPAAYAEAKTNVTLDVTDGSITITSSGYTIGNDVLNSYTGDYTIIQTDSSTSNTIEVSGGVCNITLSGINISTTTTSPFSVAENAEVTLTLVGDNVLDASSASGYAGLAVPSGATITIQGDGSLIATGGSYGAGIGGSKECDGGNITINEGTITATGGASGNNLGTGAGIGGGGTYDNSAGSGGVITINGGVITATGGQAVMAIGTGAGIGGGGTESGTAGAGDQVTIQDGTVIATGGSSSNTETGTGAGIGGGGSRGANDQSHGGDGGMLTVIGGTVTATGGTASGNYSGTGAGIGGGGVGGLDSSSNSASVGSGGTVIITGGIVTASGGNESYDNSPDDYDDDLYGGLYDDLYGDVGGGVIQDVQYSGAGIGSGRKYGDDLSVSGKVTIAVYMKYGTSASSTINTFTYGTGIAIDSFDFSQYVIVQPILIMNSSPKDVSAAYGNTVELSAEAITAEKDSVITYQWYSCSDDEPIKDATSATLKLSSLEVGTYCYYCVASCTVNDVIVTAKSDRATVTITQSTTTPNWVPTADDAYRLSFVSGMPVEFSTSQVPYNFELINELQGPLCFDVFHVFRKDYAIGATYSSLVNGMRIQQFSQEITVTLQIPSSLQKENRSYEMICVSQDGNAMVLADLDTNPNTITFTTDKGYAFVLCYKD